MNIKMNPINKTNIQLQEETLFNCFHILSMNGINIDEITLEEVNTLFSLNTKVCPYCEEELVNGVCKYKHYIVPHIYIIDYITFIKEKFGANNSIDYLEQILEDYSSIKCGKVCKDVGNIYLRLLLDKLIKNEEV